MRPAPEIDQNKENVDTSQQPTTTPGTQDGWRLHAWGGEPVWERFARPEPGPGEVLVQVEACGVGLTVLNALAGDLGDDPAALPRVPGHELVGRVVRAGGPEGASLVGRRVMAYFYLACGSCQECAAGREPLCLRLAGNLGVVADGGYAPWTVLGVRQLVVVPDALDPVDATVVPDAVATPIHVCARAQVRPGDRMAVIGAGGGVGAHLVQVAALFGAQVTALDVHDGKLADLAELGATPVRSDDFARLDASRWRDGAPTVVVDLVGSAESLAWAAAAVVVRGRVVVVTTFRDRLMSVDPRHLVQKETTLLGSRYASRRELMDAADLVLSGRVRPVIGMRGGPERVPDMHAALRSGQLFGRGALVWP